jgi:hypothetical protein
VPDTYATLAEIDARIADVRENLRELVEQAAAYSGSADDELTSRRIDDQQTELDRLTKQRDALASFGSRQAGSATTSETAARSDAMQDSRVKPHMDVIGADGVHIGTVDRVENGRIKLTKADSGEGQHKGHHHFIELGLVAGVEGQKVRLSANAAVAVTLEEEGSGKPV